MSTSLGYFSTSPPTSSSSATSPVSHFESFSRKRQQKKMSLTQTYFLAHTARKKLTTEAARADHDLRLLVGHANLLDTLMLELSDAEQEQERWFNQSVNGASQEEQSQQQQQQQQQRVKFFADADVEEPEEDWTVDDISDADSDLSSDEDDDEDYDEEDFLVNSTAPVPIPGRRPPSPAPIITEHEIYDEDEDDDESEFEYEEDGMEDLEELTLTRSSSRMQNPPELSSDSDESSDEDSPPTPTQAVYGSFDVKPASVETTKLTIRDQAGLLDRSWNGRSETSAIEAF